MAISIAAFVVNVIEAGILHRHLQTYTGYAEYNYAVNNQEVSGNYGLTWTFETQSTSKRLASFFADPLELASSIMLGFAVGLIFYLTSERKDYFLYAVVMLCSTASLFFSSSRAAFAAFFFMLFYIAIVFRLYKLIIAGASLLGSFILYVLFLSSDDFYYFVVDTITFQNASSVGHVIEWLEALDSMIANPMGIGLAMSGNVASVTDELRIGGENQFLIFGVQLGFLGMFLYILLLACAIVISIRVFRLSPDTNAARIAFVAASVKVGMLLPLFTANAELYMYVSWITWWMVGYSVKEYNKIKYASTLLL
ncbi:O-antigen ligase family protein [Anditalea andensis]|nr:O-antigen ligase family protein [Anditalea andensis]